MDQALSVALMALQTPLQRHHELVVNNMMCAGFAVLIYDHAITLDYEVDLIWRAPKNIVPVIFLLNRYLVPAFIIGQFYEKFAPSHTLEFCRVWVFLQGYLTIISYVSLHAVVALRVSAIHNDCLRIKRMLWIGGIFYALSTTGLITGASLAILRNLESKATGACVVTIPRYLWATWLPTVVFESTLFILTVYLAVCRFTSYQSFGALYRSLLRDGVIYFLVVTLSSTATLLVWAKASSTLIELARPFSLCIVTVAGSRLILNLKIYALEKSQKAQSDTKTPISMSSTSPDFEFRSYSS